MAIRVAINSNKATLTIWASAGN